MRFAAGPPGPPEGQRAREATRLVVGITGATGAVLGVRLLEVLGGLDGVETHLVMSRWARTSIELETGYTAREVAKLADVAYAWGDQAAAISSGSFPTCGMVVIPCSMKTLSGIRAGYAEGLLGRAADVTLKERRPLVLVPRGRGRRHVITLAERAPTSPPSTSPGRSTACRT